MDSDTRIPLWAMVLLVVVALGAWQAAFAVTGIGAEAPRGTTVAPPPPVALPPLDTSWVDLQVYLKNHQVWRP